MKNITTYLFSLCLTLALAVPASASLLAGYSAGTGENTSSMILDFGFNGGDAYLFEYSYDGSATAEDMLLGLDAAGDLTVDRQFFEFSPGVFSIFINGFSYDGNTSVPIFEGSNGESWSYWIEDLSPSAPGFWLSSPTGATDRVLEDGSFDGWALNVSQFVQGNFDPTNDPPAVPEPTSAALLALAGTVLLRRRRSA